MLIPAKRGVIATRVAKGLCPQVAGLQKFAKFSACESVKLNILQFDMIFKSIHVCQCRKTSLQKTSLLHRLQAQTLPDEAPPVGKIFLFSKIAVTFEPIQRFRISEKMSIYFVL